jgi:hypothetical protein
MCGWMKRLGVPDSAELAGAEDRAQQTGVCARWQRNGLAHFVDADESVLAGVHDGSCPAPLEQVGMMRFKQAKLLLFDCPS